MKLLIVAHPDDEILWFNPQSFDRILIVFLEGHHIPRVSEGRKKVLAEHPLREKIKLLNLIETNYQRDVNKRDIFVKNSHLIKEKLKEEIKNVDCIYTHNPWGEYGHPEHIQISSMVVKLAQVPVFAFDGIVPSSFGERKIEKIDLELYRKIKAIYLKHGAWTWHKDYEPKSMQPYFQLK